MIILKGFFFLILFLKCKLKNRTCRNVFIVFIKTLHSLVLYIITLVISILFENYVFITISLVANSRYVISIPQASNARSVLLVTMATPPKERLKTANRVRVLWRPHPISKYLRDPVNSYQPMRGPWEAHGSSSFLDVYVELQFYLCNRFQYGNLRKWV